MFSSWCIRVPFLKRICRVGFERLLEYLREMDIDPSERLGEFGTYWIPKLDLPL